MNPGDIWTDPTTGIKYVAEKEFGCCDGCAGRCAGHYISLCFDLPKCGPNDNNGISLIFKQLSE